MFYLLTTSEVLVTVVVVCNKYCVFGDLSNVFFINIIWIYTIKVDTNLYYLIQ